MWNMKCFAIALLTAATVIVSKGLKKYLETIPGKRSVDSTTSSCTRDIVHTESATEI